MALSVCLNLTNLVKVQKLAQAIASSKGFSIAGGGDTLAAIDKYGVALTFHIFLQVAVLS
jgi:hypothetical protein